MSKTPIARERPLLENYVSRKVNGWQGLLIEYLSKCAQASFRPGKLDCGLFFAEGLKVMTGGSLDIAEPFRGNYRTIEEGLEIARNLGYSDHATYAESFFPSYPSVLWAAHGDGAVLEDARGVPVLGIVQGANIYVMGLQGIGLVPLTSAKRTFPV